MAIMSSIGAQPKQDPWYRPQVGQTKQYEGQRKLFLGGGLMTPDWHNDQPQAPVVAPQQSAGAPVGGGGVGGMMAPPPQQIPTQAPAMASMPMTQSQPSAMFAGGMEQQVGPWWPTQYAWQVNNQQPWSLEF